MGLVAVFSDGVMCLVCSPARVLMRLDHFLYYLVNPSETANHSRFGNMLGLGNDEEQFLMAMQKYKDQPLLDARAAEMKGWRNAS